MSGVRWKYKDAKQFSLENPISEVYDKMRSMTPIKSLLKDTAVLLEADACQSELLNSAYFGRLLLVGPRSKVSLDHINLPISTDLNEEVFVYELGLEEAFFMCHELNCLRVYHKSSKGEWMLNASGDWRHISTSELWLLLVEKESFLCFYKAYHHLRIRNWIVRNGKQYGTDLIAYRHHPSQVHAEYAVIIISESEKQTQLSSWSSMQGTIRLCGSVAKTLLLLQVIQVNPHDSQIKNLDKYLVQETIVKRWLPNKSRMGGIDGSGCKP